MSIFNRFNQLPPIITASITSVAVAVTTTACQPSREEEVADGSPESDRDAAAERVSVRGVDHRDVHRADRHAGQRTDGGAEEEVRQHEPVL